jgi:ABC-type sulfate transport system substrate-binding protein
MSLRRYALAALASAIFAGSAVAKDYELLNVSYDPTRELYQDYNTEFTSFWKASHPVTTSKSSNPTAVQANRPVVWSMACALMW